MPEVIAEVDGAVEPGFELVATEFSASFLERGEHGAAFAAVVDGRLVVDLWGGTADHETVAPWREDTVQLVFSGAKGLVAVCILLLIERGQIDLDAPVSDYWPEFAASGKRRLLVRHVVSHTAGLPGLRTPLTLADLTDFEHMTSLVAAEEPLWKPGERLAYHPLTFGWICGGLVLRVTGRSPGVFFAEEVAAPLELELWIGLPLAVEARVARLRRAATYRINPAVRSEPNPLYETVYANPPFLTGERFPWNERAFHAAEIPAVNAVGTARSIARLYGCLARGGEIDGVRLLSEETTQLGRHALAEGRCVLTARPYAFGVGFELQTELAAFGPAADAFGHTGAGGSVHGAWPGLQTGFSYAMNELRAEDADDRARCLLRALHTSIVRRKAMRSE
jgi:CubicO group peptidase (beta-lactamase class C family)